MVGGRSQSVRFIISHRLAGKRSEDELRASHEALEAALELLKPDMTVHRDSRTSAVAERRSLLVEGDPRAVAARRRHLHDDVLVEAAADLRLHGLKDHTRRRSESGRAEDLHAIDVEVRGNGTALRGAEVALVYADWSLSPVEHTDRNGRAVLRADTPPVFLVVQPADGFWSACVPRPREAVVVRCQPLPRTGPTAWWHHAVGIRECRDDDGAGIRIAVVGTGVGPHPRLSHVHAVDGSRDSGAHDTHVCGIIAARPRHPWEISGLARGATVFSAQIFDAEDRPQHVDAVARTIDRLARPTTAGGYGVDLINLSWGDARARASIVLHDAIQYAFDHGALCLCAAGDILPPPGNDARRRAIIESPARFPEAVAVAMLGSTRWGAAHSTTRFWRPRNRSWMGRDRLYLAALSGFGRKVVCAPGSGILSTFPARFGFKTPYATMDGTSAAVAVASGFLARVLAAAPEYLQRPRNQHRAAHARRLLLDCCTDLGLPRGLQGHGMPSCR